MSMTHMPQPTAVPASSYPLPPLADDASAPFRVVQQRGSALSLTELYDILRLRVEVYIEEQDVSSTEVLDGQDTLPEVTHYWMVDPQKPDSMMAYLRAIPCTTADDLNKPVAAMKLGRIATRKAYRGQGLASLLIHQAIKDARLNVAVVVLDAQTQLTEWYARRFGFVANPAQAYVVDNVPITPMVLIL